ncbi:Sapep family Mn(2+)-dependent dipeptidase [Erysipelotrichaceae bacterium OttesenSCG-928-M19]|nr:Sapep family Mn(2+)-dependent dipeptidase [Erysipelotrichaceae bacterium OttesenSCG-928-M19]
MNEKEFNDFIKASSRLIEIPSVLSEPLEKQPFGVNVDRALQETLIIAEELGFETYCDPNGYYGYAQIGDGEQLFGILCHVDVVPAGDLSKWQSNPFKLEIRDDKIYGRGIQDDKGPTILSMYALKHLLDQGLIPKQKIRFIFGTDEENLWRCMANYTKNEKIPDMGIVPDSIFPVTYAEKGLFQFDLISSEKISFDLEGGEAYNSVASSAQTKTNDILQKNLSKTKINYEISDGQVKVIGKSAHVKDADQGENAIVILAQLLKDSNYQAKMLDFIVDKLDDVHGKSLFGDISDDISGKLMLNLGKACFQEDHQRIALDLRVPVSYPQAEVEAVLKKACAEYDLSFELVDYVKPLYVNVNSDLVKKLMEAYQNVTKDYESKPMSSGGATYARTMPNFVAFGTDLITSESTAHQANEHVRIDDYKLAFDIYVEAYRLLVF